MSRDFCKAGFIIILFWSLYGCLNIPSSRLINGVSAPDITLPDKENNLVTLSSFRGKIVLLDFWASWCAPCRKENPKVVDIYNKYHDASFQDADGFTIYSVSFDSDRQKWLTAIEEDGLKWQNQVSELNGWSSSAVDSFDVTSIPASFLLDQNGIIIGKDLSYRDLDMILSKRLAK